MRVVEYEGGRPIYELTLDECKTYGYCYPCYGACIGYEPDNPRRPLPFENFRVV